ADALALRTLRRPGLFVLGKDEAAAPAAGGLDPDVLVGRPRRLEQVPEVVFDLFAGELQLVCDGRRRSGLAEHLLDLLAHGHVPSIVRDMTVATVRASGGCRCLGGCSGGGAAARAPPPGRELRAAPAAAPLRRPCVGA